MGSTVMESENLPKGNEKEVGEGEPTMEMILNGAKRRRPNSFDSECNFEEDKWLQTFYTWTPSAFGMEKRKSGESLLSPAFSHDGLEWRLCLYPRGYNTENQDYFSLFLELLTSVQDYSVVAKFAFFTRNDKGEYRNRMSGEHRFALEKTIAGFSRYLRRSDLVDGFNGLFCQVRAQKQKPRSASSPSSSDDDGTDSEPQSPIITRSYRRSGKPAAKRLNLNTSVDQELRRSLKLSKKSEVTVRGERGGEPSFEHVDAETQTSEVAIDCCAKMSVDFEKLVFDKNFSDVTIFTNNKQFYAHKAILSARSPVFHTMFDNEIKTKSVNEVKISDVHDDVFEDLLRFIYTGKIVSPKVITAELMIAGHKYGLLDLKTICEKSIAQMLTVDSVSNILILADRYSAKHLKDKAIHFINEHAADVLKSEGYKLLVKSYLYLIEELYRFRHSN